MPEEKIVLNESDIYYTTQPKDTFMVEEGTAMVYVVPWENDRPGRRIFVCEVEKGKMIPSFKYKDRNYKDWSFCLLAKEKCTLTHRSGNATSILYRNFSNRIGLKNFQQEGFEQALVEFYQTEVVKDDAYIGRGQKAEPEVAKASHVVIKQVFDNEQDVLSGNQSEYLVLEYACQKSGIPLLPPDEIIARCGKKAGITDIANASKFICRPVVLEADWHKQDCGPIISHLNGQPVACVPDKSQKYHIFYGETKRSEKLTQKLARQVSPQAFSIGRALPNKKLTRKDIVSFCMKSLRRKDLISVILLGLLCTIVGILLPTLNQKLYDDHIPMGNYEQLFQLCMVIGSFTIGNLFFSIVKSLSGFRISSKMGYDLQNAAYFKTFHLKESFFRDYDSADLAERLMEIAPTVTSFANTIVVTGLSTVFSLLYLYRMFKYSSKLSWIALLMYLCYFSILALLTFRSIRYEASIEESGGEARAKLYQYLNGIEKIRMAGVEERAAYSYLKPFAHQQSSEIKKNRLLALSSAITCVISTVFSMVFYFIIVKQKINVSIGSYMAFNTAFGAFTGALQALLTEIFELYRQKKKIERFAPLLTTPPEDDGNKEVPGKLEGSVHINHVSFSYQSGGNKVLEDISMSIKPGEYVGIVGASGCGKSTLLKLLLGFETPDSGSVLFDSKDLNEIDKGMLRKQLGVVLQNGKLIAGSIYDNITITAPHTRMSDVNAVIDAVGLRDDINQMPMGIHTMLSENSSTISGGQQQRILIARAIISNPAILIFDEATSALDNITQAAVCDSLDKMNITRIVVAHRLSTIKTCDRIFVLDKGRVAEEGNYDSLMKQKGLFYQLASRQIAE